VTPRHWEDAPGTQRWSGERARRDRGERREWFALFAAFVGAAIVFAILASLGAE